MSNEISFELAKWLQLKDFDRPCYDCFDNNGKTYLNGWCENVDHNKVESPFQKIDIDNEYVLKPEPYQIVDWLFEDHQIFVEVFRQRGINGHNFNFMCVSTKPGENHSTPIPIDREEGYKTPYETYLAAFDYIKTNNLI